MGVLGTLVRTAQTYPALLPLILLSVFVAIWARRKRRFGLMIASVVLAALAVFFYTGRRTATAMAVAAATAPPAEVARPVEQVHAANLLHPRFPEDFPVPTFFHHEHTRGQRHHGALTVRFRFRGSPPDAVRDLAEAGRLHGWTVEQTAPHRLLFRKGDRSVEAWFSFPGLSLVLDVPDPR